jgi:DNA-binding HxlR family transcriptional regulator
MSVMLGRTYEDQVCSVARTLEIVGERWTLLILRDGLLGIRRFDDFQKSLGVARNVLADRLNTLVETGLFEKVRYQTGPERFEYRPTVVGRDLATAIFALMRWGDRHLATKAGPPRLLEHTACGGRVDVELACDECDETISVAEVSVIPGPGLRPRSRRRPTKSSAVPRATAHPARHQKPVDHDPRVAKRRRS